MPDPNLALIPNDILAEIFVHSLAGEPTDFPPSLSEPPWLLGRVCSRWRQIVLQEPRIWCNLRFDICKLPPRALAETLLSRSWFLSLTLISETYQPRLEDELQAVHTLIVPNLPRIRELHMDLTLHDHAIPGLLTALPEALTSMEFLSLVVSGKIEPKFESLLITTPIFRMARSLRKLHIDWGRHTNIFARLDIPWHQLTDLELGFEDMDTSSLLGILSKCSRLEKLSSYIAQPSFSESRVDEVDVRLPQLKWLALSGYPNDARLYLSIPDGSLTHLDLRNNSHTNLRPTDVYSIFAQHPGLQSLHARISKQDSEDEDSGGEDSDAWDTPLILPNLTSLSLLFNDNDDILQILFAPALSELDFAFMFSTRPGRIMAMIASSGCSISRYRHTGWQYSSQDPTLIEDVFAAMPALVGLEERVPLPANILRRLTNGTILPRLEVINVVVRDVWMFLDAVEARSEARRRSAPGIGHLRRARVRAPFRAGAKERSEQLQKEYGVEIYIQIGADM